MAEVFSPDLSGAYDQKNIIDLFRKNEQQVDNSDYGNNQDYRSAIQSAAKGAQSSAAAGGGLGGMLTSGGLNLGISSMGAAEGSKLAGMGGLGAGAAGAGLLISAIEARRAENAKREQQAIENEMNKRAQLINIAQNAAGNQFRLA